jgi:hypothetical protein
METTTEKRLYHKASNTPLEDIAVVSYTGQHPSLRRYLTGYENYLNCLPVMTNENAAFREKEAKLVMKSLSNRLKHDNWMQSVELNDGEFKRTIIGIEKPTHNNGELQENAELVVAHWGKGFKSPIHGHSTGMMYEEVLYGMLKVFNYQVVDLPNKIVRHHHIDIVKEGVFVNNYTPHNSKNRYKRQTLIHNFEALTRTETLHFLPEHTRDGRDNTFTLETWDKLTIDQVTRIDAMQGMYLRKGEVILVRSENVPEYGDHFIVVVGPPVMKEHGLRVQDVSIPATANETRILDAVGMKMGLTLLKLNAEARDSFLQFHNITIEDNEVVFPNM